VRIAPSTYLESFRDLWYFSSVCISAGLTVQVPTASEKRQNDLSRSSDYSTSSSSLSSPSMSPQSSWDSALPSLNLDYATSPAASSRTSYFPSPSYNNNRPQTLRLQSEASSYAATPAPSDYQLPSISLTGHGHLPPMVWDSSSRGPAPLSATSSSETLSHHGRYSDLGRGSAPIAYRQSSGQSPSTSGTAGSKIKDLIARSAASIPPPPPLLSQRTSFSLNSTNTVVYSSTALRNNAVGLSVGLVKLSPLTSCSPQCRGECGGAHESQK